MKLRELLQIELWSKRTTRRILVGFVVAVIAFGVVFTVEVKWTTPGERDAAKRALAELDALQKLDSGNYQESAKKTFQADKMIDAADQAASTLRDERIVRELRSYSDWIQYTANVAETRRIEKRLPGGKTDANQVLDQQADVLNGMVGVLSSGMLHKALD
jgi:hypothetical protein